MSSVLMPASHVSLASREAAADRVVARPWWLPVVFLVPAAMAGASWLLRGVPALTDSAFLALTVLCVVCLVVEFASFSRRVGVGGLALFGGVLVWFCYDYHTNWHGRSAELSSAALPDLAGTPLKLVLARAAFFHALFVAMMVAGLLVPWGAWMRRVIHAVPEPASGDFYLAIAVVTLIVGLLPFLFLTEEPWHEAIWLAITGGRAGGPTWTVGRTGNVNLAWQGYYGQLLQIGQLGGNLAVFYAILVACTPGRKIVGWCIWAFWLAIAFGSGTRGEVAFMGLPPMALLFLKYQPRASSLLTSRDRKGVVFSGAGGNVEAQTAPLRSRLVQTWIAPPRFGLKAYLAAGALLLLVLVLVQLQARYRTETYKDIDLREIHVLDLQGNAMFSEGLLGWAVIPEQAPPYYSRFTGEALLRPIPDAIADFFVTPIPRALWRSKPVDPVWEWYNAIYNNTSEGREGTTIAQGLVGHWYFRYGLWGVLEGGLLVGWLLGVGERSLRHARGRPIAVLFSLAFVVWLFRNFRAYSYIDLHPLIVGAVTLTLLVLLERVFLRRSRQAFRNAPPF